jgi:SnoaL-like polyketide cyclase
LADQLFASNYVNHGSLIPDLVEGPECIKFSVALYRAAFPDLHIRVDSLSSIAGTVQLRWTARSTFADSGSGIAGTASVRHALTGVTRSSVAGGQIVESWMNWDSTVAMQMLGVLRPGNDETS